jgi:MFS family permease
MSRKKRRRPMSRKPLVPKRWYQGLTGYHWLVLTVASCGWLFDTMDQWIYNLQKGPAIRSLLESTTHMPAADPTVLAWTTYCTTLMLVGWATGGFLFGMVGDRLGRTKTMMITVLVYAGFTGVTYFAKTPGQFAWLRFFTGLGIGGEFAAGAALVAETFPEHARASALGVMQATSALGNVMACLVNLTIGSHTKLSLFGHQSEGWRCVFLIGFLPAILTAVIRLYVKEPQKWEHARDTARARKKSLGSLLDLFRDPTLRRNTLVGVGIAAVGVIGFWGLATWSADLLRGILNPSHDPTLKDWAEQRVSIAVLVQQAGAFFGMLSWTYLAQWRNRRAAFFATFASSLVSVLLAFTFTKTFGTAMVFFPLMGFCTTSIFCGCAIYFPELYPTRLRATGTGFNYNVARYLAIAGPMTLGALGKKMGLVHAAQMVSSVFILGLIILIWAPETKGKPLPEDL